MDDKTVDAAIALADLRSETCRCGQPKNPDQTFCRGCYFKLPPSRRRRLYDLIGEGYEEAYAAALAELRLEASA